MADSRGSSREPLVSSSEWGKNLLAEMGVPAPADPDHDEDATSDAGKAPAARRPRPLPSMFEQPTAAPARDEPAEEPQPEPVTGPSDSDGEDGHARTQDDQAGGQADAQAEGARVAERDDEDRDAATRPADGSAEGPAQDTVAVELVRLRRTVRYQQRPDGPPVPLPTDAETVGPYVAAVTGRSHQRLGAEMPRLVHDAWSRHVREVTDRQRTSPSPSLVGRSRANEGVPSAVALMALHATVPVAARLRPIADALGRSGLYDRTVQMTTYVPFHLPAAGVDVFDGLHRNLVEHGLVAHRWQTQLLCWAYTLDLRTPRATDDGARRLDELLGTG